MRRCNNSPWARGFSLLEVLVAFSLFAVVAAAVLDSFGTGMQQLGRARDVTKAVFLAENKLKETAFRIEQLASTPGTGTQEGKGPQLQPRRWQGEADEMQWEAVARLEPGPPGRTHLYHISVTVQQRDGAPIRLQTWRAVAAEPTG